MHLLSCDRGDCTQPAGVTLKSQSLGKIILPGVGTFTAVYFMILEGFPRSDCTLPHPPQWEWMDEGTHQGCVIEQSIPHPRQQGEHGFFKAHLEGDHEELHPTAASPRGHSLPALPLMSQQLLLLPRTAWLPRLCKWIEQRSQESSHLEHASVGRGDENSPKQKKYGLKRRKTVSEFMTRLKRLKWALN